MKKLLLAVCLLSISAAASLAQNNDKITKVTLSQLEIDRIIKKTTENEGIFRNALNNYSFKRDALTQTIGFGAGQITGEYHRTSVFTFDDSGTKYEKILFFPMSTLKEIEFTTEDLEDLGGVTPYALEPKNAALYNYTFVGKEKIDDLDLYVFDVAPKVMPDPGKKIRLFKGRIWIEDRDLQIVKSKGKGVPETKKYKYPIVETWRENIGGKYWFPTYATSDDELTFDSGSTVKLRMRVKYTDYKEASATVRVLEDTEEVAPDKPQPSPTPAPAKKP